MEWFEPRNFGQWLKRAFGLRPILAVLIVLGFFITEFRFDWVEKALGAYLVRTNPVRPQSGQIWDEGHSKITARQTLEKIVADRMTNRREVQGAASLSELFASMSDGKEGVMLSPDHFRSLYLALPPSISHEILSPFEMIEILNSGQWDRTYVEKNGPELTIYLLDDSNRVLRQLQVSSDLLYRVQQQEAARLGTLDSLPEFRNRIYPADRFFAELASLPDDVRGQVVPQPENLLKISGRIRRVGIADEVVSGFIELAFEVESGTRKKVVFIQGREWAVWLLRTRLKDTQPPKTHFPTIGPTGEKNDDQR